MQVIILILSAFYFALPAYIANMAPVLIAKPGLCKCLARPIDNDRTWRGKPILGKGKTWRGLIAGVLAAIIIAGIQMLLFRYSFFQSISVVDFNEVNFLIFGALAGLGAMIGDSVKSFFKRRIGIKSGAAWPIADQLDFIIGFLLFTYCLVRPEIIIMIIVIAITPLLHLLTNVIGYKLKLKKVWW